MTDRIITTVWLAFLVTIIATIGLLWKAHFNVGNLLFIGNYFKAARYWYENPIYQVGYDGQFYYTIANNPFDISYLSATLDNAEYRYRRLLYPMIVWLVSMGGHLNIPYTMLLLNGVFITLSSLLIALIFLHQRIERREYYIAAAFLPGLLFSLKYNLAEALGVFLVLVGVYTYLRKKYGASALLLLLSALAREIYILVPVCLVTYELIQSRKFKWSYIMALCCYGLYWLFIRYLFLSSANEQASVFLANFSLPGFYFAKLIRQVGDAMVNQEIPPSYAVLFYLYVIYLIRFFVIAIKHMLQSSLGLFSALAFIFGFIVLSFGQNIWSLVSGPESFVRVSDLFLVFSFIAYAVEFRDRWGTRFTPLLYICVFIYIIQFPDIGIYYAR